MFLTILKKDLKRKKTMNVILLLFITLASIFISSSTNNMISIITALDQYISKSEVRHHNLFIHDSEADKKKLDQFLAEHSLVQEKDFSYMIYLNSENVKRTENKIFDYANMITICSPDILFHKIFDKDNNIISTISDGELYIPFYLMDLYNFKVGETITIQNDNFSMEFTIAGGCKDILFNSPLMGMSRLIISSNDYQAIQKSNIFPNYIFYSIHTTDVKQFENDYNKAGISTIVSLPQSLLKTMYIMDMVQASILLLISLFLIVISFVLLHFTIVFTLNEEFREIGIMKAIGIGNRKIRQIYYIKYLALSIIGAMIGFFLGIPFGDRMLQEVSRNIVIEGSNNYYINILSSILIVGIIAFFCLFCTRKIKKITPIMAIHNGSTGERYHRKSIFRLGKNNMPTVLFMALNDIFSESRKFIILLITFIIGVILIIIPINTVATLKSDHLVTWFSMIESEHYMSQHSLIDTSTQSRESIQKSLNEIRDKLLKQNIDADIFQEIIFNSTISFEDKTCQALSFQGTGTTTDQYMYIKGSAPQKENELAITHVIADKLNIHIGDTITNIIGDTKKEFIITAIFQSMINMGETIRYSEELVLDCSQAFGSGPIQIKYTDQPNAKEKEKRQDLLTDLFPNHTIRTGGEYMLEMLGVAVQFNDIINLIILVVLCINGLVCILMVKSFILKETAQIGMLKALGFNNKTIMTWQTVRIGIILILSTLLGIILSEPLAQISSGLIFKMMGASSIQFEKNILEAYVIYPLLVFIVTMLVSFITSGQIKKISTTETNSIE